MKTGPVSKHLVIFLNFPCLIACLLCCLLMSFVCLFAFWLGICVEVDVDRITILSPPPLPPPHFFPTHNSLFNTSDSYQFEIRGRLKLVSVPLAVKSYILVTLRKVSRRASCKALRWDKTFLRFAESASSNIVLYSRFIWLNGSITLIRAETERYDIVRFFKVTAKSLASGTGS